MKKIILTFDLEYWYESVSLQPYLNHKEKESLIIFVNKLLFLLKQTNSTATFFVTGKVLDDEPEIIEKIFNAGHEIAMHSLDHKTLYNKNANEFNEETKIMIEKIVQITDKKPIGHRAVNFSLNQKTSWALKKLVDNNFKYDSSIFPFKLSPIFLSFFKESLYGLRSKIFTPYKIDLKNPEKKDHDSSLVELPISVFHNFFFKLPLTGGIYIRLIPWIVFKNLLKNKLKKETACIHFHAFDFADRIPNIKMPYFKKIIKYYNIKKTWHKLEYIVNKFNCISAEKYLYENSIN